MTAPNSLSHEACPLTVYMPDYCLICTDNNGRRTWAAKPNEGTENLPRSDRFLGSLLHAVEVEVPRKTKRIMRRSHPIRYQCKSMKLGNSGAGRNWSAINGASPDLASTDLHSELCTCSSISSVGGLQDVLSITLIKAHH